MAQIPPFVDEGERFITVCVGGCLLGLAAILFWRCRWLRAVSMTEASVEFSPKSSQLKQAGFGTYDVRPLGRNRPSLGRGLCEAFCSWTLQIAHWGWHLGAAERSRGATNANPQPCRTKRKEALEAGLRSLPASLTYARSALETNGAGWVLNAGSATSLLRRRRCHIEGPMSAPHRRRAGGFAAAVEAGVAACEALGKPWGPNLRPAMGRCVWS